MIVEELKLINFRNYEQIEIQFHPKLNIFIGNNGQGKTNILEAIYLSALGKSFRTNRDHEMINILNRQAYIKVKIEKTQKNNKIIEININEEKKKKIKINDLPLLKTSELFGNLNAVLFSPEDLKIIKEGPGERRKFIDNEISQIIPKYYFILNKYNKVLQQRNSLLKDKKRKKLDLEIWNEQLIYYGIFIINYRKNFIKRIGILSKLMHRKITDNIETLEIEYESNIKFKKDIQLNELKTEFQNKLKEIQEEEIKRGLTLAGPHRDEIKFTINGINLRNYGSQGQQRTAVLSLKLAELELIKAERGEYPVLLLDDVMSELDQKRQIYLMNNIKNIQTFITSTDINYLNIKEGTKYKIYNVFKGQINILND